MENAATCGEATIRLLAEHGVGAAFGAPSARTLDFCREEAPWLA